MIADSQVVKENIFECSTSLPFIDYLTILKCYYRSIRIFALFFTSFLMYISSTVMLLSRINLKWTFEVRNKKNVVINQFGSFRPEKSPFSYHLSKNRSTVIKLWILEIYIYIVSIMPNNESFTLRKLILISCRKRIQHVLITHKRISRQP